ncbi:MAG TPA: DNA methyltransferase [Acidimicrobiales bacterium]|nr:DNA methyltransferase [Acidimicrobiales bacterium]
MEPLPIWSEKRMTAVSPSSCLEQDYPGAEISLLAEVESWRKEIHRPATHTHKWWAQRLGTVFRSIVVSAVTNSASEALAAYKSATRLPGIRILDPFAGSGTTIVEALKLGASAIGVDINPVATLVQRQAVTAWDVDRLRRALKRVEKDCRSEIDELHLDVSGHPVLYYFWVAAASCPECAVEVELFSSYVFARHAYAKRFPEAQATCPDCHAVVPINLARDEHLFCKRCSAQVALAGPVQGQFMTCSNGHRSRVIQALGGHRPKYRPYAKLVLTPSGKAYVPIDEFDLDLYREASRRLANARAGQLVLPQGELSDGYNTVQAIKWGFRSWRDFFNDRQLYCLGLLGAAVRDLDCEIEEREALAALFSGCLEFNNLFCSYKGEGTGAVRHMFSHHILKPERTPLEAHPWGTRASSGSFSTLFESRLLRAFRYKMEPSDLILNEAGRAIRTAGLSVPLQSHSADFAAVGSDAVLLTGDAASTPLQDSTIDLVVTDPPYMDNVHYSELADFFHAWLTEVRPYRDYPIVPTTRAVGEVQGTDHEHFAKGVGAVWRECARVLKPEGLLAFTFHQARMEGWLAVMNGLRDAGFVVTATQPVKAEMSVAAPKSGAKEPSTLDTIVVCRKVGVDGPAHSSIGSSPDEAAEWAVNRLHHLETAGIQFGPSDVRSVVRGTVLSLLTRPGARDDTAIAVAADRLAEAAATSYRSLGLVGGAESSGGPPKD